MFSSQPFTKIYRDVHCFWLVLHRMSQKDEKKHHPSHGVPYIFQRDSSVSYPRLFTTTQQVGTWQLIKKNNLRKNGKFHKSNWKNSFCSTMFLSWKLENENKNYTYIYIYVHILYIYIYVYIWMKPTSSLSRLSRAQLYSPTILPILNEMNNLHVQRLNKHRLKATGKNSHQTGHLFISSADAWAWHQKWQHPQPWHLKHEMGKQESLYHQQKQGTIIREIYENYHTFALFDPPGMGNFMTPGKTNQL